MRTGRASVRFGVIRWSWTVCAWLLSTSVLVPSAYAQDGEADVVETEADEIEADESTDDQASQATPRRYRYDLALDLPLTTALLVVGAGSNLVTHELAAPSRGDPADVHRFDRGVARRVALREGPRVVSDVLLTSSMALGVVGAAFSLRRSGIPERGERIRERFRRVGVFVETLAANQAATTIVKLAVRRPRPYTYADDYDPADATFDASLSHFSGHTSTVAAVSASLTYFAFVEQPRSARAYATLGTGLVVTSTVATLRVRAGKHFPSDVLAGGLVGAAIGVMVPHLHLRRGLSVATEVGRDGAMLRVFGFLGGASLTTRSEDRREPAPRRT